LTGKSEKKPGKIREAVALEYQPDRGVPQVTATGTGRMAERIIESAQENAVPIHQDPELAHALNMLSIGDEIPPQLYEVVAQILIYVSGLDKKLVP